MEIDSGIVLSGSHLLFYMYPVSKQIISNQIKGECLQLMGWCVKSAIYLERSGMNLVQQ